jgi:hypothetical protein
MHDTDSEIGGIKNAQAGDQIEIQGHVFDVRSRTEHVNPSKGLTGFTIMGVEHDPYTDKTVSRLHVNSTPFELDVCNGPTYQVDPEDVRHLGSDTDSEES